MLYRIKCLGYQHLQTVHGDKTPGLGLRKELCNFRVVDNIYNGGEFVKRCQVDRCGVYLRIHADGTGVDQNGSIGMETVHILVGAYPFPRNDVHDNDFFCGKVTEYGKDCLRGTAVSETNDFFSGDFDIMRF